MTQDIRELVQSGRLADFIVGRAEYENKSHRPEQDFIRWDQVIDFYRLSATTDEKKYIGITLLEMFSKSDKQEQLPALTISRVIRMPEMIGTLIEVIQNGQYYTFDKLVQDSILVSAVSFQLEDVSEFVLNTLLEQNKIRNFVTWSDKLSDDNIATKHDLWRMHLLAKYYEGANEKKRNNIDQQVFSIHKKHKKAQTILDTFLLEARGYPSFLHLIERYMLGT
jgi:hypothetical protein